MKGVICFAIICISLASGAGFADQESLDETAYRESIMAFGVNSESAKEAAIAAIKNIEDQKSRSDDSEKDNFFAVISDEIFVNPYGF